MSKLTAVAIFEILGRPAENVVSALNSLIERIGKTPGMKIIKSRVNEPKKVEEDLFTSFAEAEIELDSIEHYFGVLFGFMPSHIEIISPSNISLDNFHLNSLANQLMQRLHNYDAIAKNMIADRDFLAVQLKQHAPKVFEQLVKQAEDARASAHAAQAAHATQANEEKQSLEEAVSEKSEKSAKSDKPKKSSSKAKKKKK